MSRTVIAPASAGRRTAKPQIPPTSWWSMTTARHATEIPTQNRKPTR